MEKYFQKSITKIIEELKTMETAKAVEVLNAIRAALHEVSPFKGEPVDFVKWVEQETVQANDYNPNAVAPPEMELLRLSIENDGYTQPIVAYDNLIHEVVDGFHRSRCGKEYESIKARVKGFLPIVSINNNRTGKADRIASTIRHNRARGKHAVSIMSDIVVDLRKRNWTDEKISKELGMDKDEVLRLYQVSGLTEMFADKEFSQAWEVA
jgi:ParB-like chromosome segregation protein Spo0J